MIRQIGDVAVADTSTVSLNSLEAIQAWQDQMVQMIDTMKGNKLVINLCSVDYPVGPILHVLATINQHAAENKIRFAVCEVGEENKKAMKMTRLSTVITVTEGEQEAIKVVRTRHKKS